MEGALLVGGTLETKPARPLSAPPGGSSLGTYPWDKALHRGVPVSVRRALLPVSPAARVHFSSLNVPHFVSQIRALPFRHTSHSSLGIASKKPMRSPGWVLCLSEVPRKPHGPADGTLCAGPKCLSLICPVSRASGPGLDTLWFACVFVE